MPLGEHFSSASIAAKYHVNKYPTLKLYRYGVMTKKEYRGARSVRLAVIAVHVCIESCACLSRQVDAFFDFIRKQVERSMIKLATPSDLITLDSNKRYIVGHFDSDQSTNYRTFSKIANLLRDECHFVASTNK